VRRRGKSNIFTAIDDPGYVPVRHAVVFFENAEHPDVAGGHEIGAADLPSDQILRRLDARIGIDEDEAVAEAAMQENRYAGDRMALVARNEIGADIFLADVEFALARESPVSFAWS